MELKRALAVTIPEVACATGAEPEMDFQALLNSGLARHAVFKAEGTYNFFQRLFCV